MKNIKLIASLFLIVIVAGTVSAFWPFDGGITGNAAKMVDYTEINDSKYPVCADSDGGVFSNESGEVLILGRIRTRSYEDKCSKTGKFVYEYYCDAKGKAKKRAFACEGGCNGGACGPKTCTPETDGVTGSLGGKIENECRGKNWFTYSCNGTEIQENRVDCSVGCDGGCTGVCEEGADVNNSIFVPGNVTIDGNLQFDSCSGNSVLQVSCDNGRFKQLGAQRCGLNKACVVGTNGAYCDNVTTTSTDTGLTSNEFGELGQAIARLNTSITAVESSVATRGASILTMLNSCNLSGGPTDITTGFANCNAVCANETATCIFAEQVMINSTGAEISNQVSACGAYYGAQGSPDKILRCLCC
jgi:hypothetical protein